MGVEHEARVAKRFRPEAQQRADVDRFKNRVYADAIAVLQHIREIHGSAVDQDEVNLRVRHAQRFNPVLRRSAGLE